MKSKITRANGVMSNRDKLCARQQKAARVVHFAHLRARHTWAAAEDTETCHVCAPATPVTRDVTSSQS